MTDQMHDHSPSAPSGFATANVSKFAPVDPMKLVRQHLRLLLVSIVIGLALAIVVDLVLYLLLPTFTTQAQLITTNPLEDPWKPSGENMQGGDQTSFFIQNQIIRLRSDDILNDALKNPELRKTDWYKAFYTGEGDAAEGERQMRAKEYLQEKGNLKAMNLRGSTTIFAYLQGSNPNELKKVLDIILTVYLDKLRSEAAGLGTNVRQVFTDERKRAEDDIERVQDRIKQYMLESDLPNLTPQYNEAQITYQLIADQEAKLRVAAQAAKDTYQTILLSTQDKGLVHSPEQIAMIERDPAVATRDERVRQLREEREAQLNRLGENHYYVKEIDYKIVSTQFERKKEFDRLIRDQEQVMLAEAKKQADGLEAQLIGLRPRLEEARTRMRDLSQKLQSFQNLDMQLKQAIDRRDKASSMLDDQRVSSTRPDAVRVRLQMGATSPRLTFPDWRVVVPGMTALYLFLVVAFLYVRETLDQRIKSPGDISLFTDADLLGVLPDAAEDPASPARVESVVQDNPSGLMAESFRQIRTTLVAHMDRLGAKTVMIVTPSAGGGASSVASNLAMSLGYVGRKVLLLDANLRRPNQHAIFGIPQQPGLVELLRGKTTVEKAIFHKVEPAVDILPAGDVRDVPPEMLEGTAFRNVLSQLEGMYDFILIDTSPALLTSDSRMMAKHLDATIVVAQANSEKRGMLSRTIRQMEGMRAQVMGIVLNRARANAGGYYKQTYDEFYRYRLDATAGKTDENKPKAKAS